MTDKQSPQADRTAVEDLVDLLDLARIEMNLFRGHSPDVSWQRVFGGQVVRQALGERYGTGDELNFHALHAYFIRPAGP